MRPMDTISIDQIANALRKARPDTTPGTYHPSRDDAVKGQRIGWRYTVLQIADSLQRTVPGFDRDAFNIACGTTTNGR